MAVSRLPEPDRSRYDLIVVGGGIYGAAAFYEASRRGLSVALLERDDFGAGTSSNSMKIIHGGLRYLQDYDFPRVLTSHRELRTLLHIAGHRVRPLHCELDTGGKGAFFSAKFRAGLLAHAGLSRLAGPAWAPRVPTCAFPGWYDGLVEDTEHLLLDYLHTGVRLGGGRSAVRNACTVEDYVRDGGRVVAARTSALGEIACDAVVDCTGAAAARAVGLAMNLVVDPLELAPGDRAVGLPHPDGRFVFVVPWRGRCMVGTWEATYPFEAREPFRFDPTWIDGCLEWLAPAHPELAGLSRQSVRFVHAGVLPRDDPADAGLSRSDRADLEPDGRVRVLGVKYTTARPVAARAVEMAAESAGLPDRASGPPPPLVDRNALLAEFARDLPDGDTRAAPGAGPTRADVLFGIECEQARTLADVLLRRTSAATAGHPGRAVVDGVADLCAHHLGWSSEERSSQVEAFENDYRLG